MKLVKKILNKLNGLYYPQEYLCLTNETLQDTLHAWLARRDQVIKDITNLHLFVGYSPLIFVLPPLKELEQDESAIIDILFTNKLLHPNETLSSKDAIAVLRLKKLKQQIVDEGTFSYFEGIKGEHRFLSRFHQYIIGLNNRLNNRKAGNVFLHDNLYKQVQIAYSIPRNISLITVMENDMYNLFPTDLHGQIDNQHYIISLRQSGKACQQVMETGKILITQIDSLFFKTAYALGKNHMRHCAAKEDFPFSSSVSANLRLPLPESALFYRELEFESSFVHGIHRLFLFKILSRQQVRPNPSTLAHVHNVYATWRHNNEMTGNYLLR
jgi:hypothetical protein